MLPHEVSQRCYSCRVEHARGTQAHRPEHEDNTYLIDGQCDADRCDHESTSNLTSGENPSTHETIGGDTS